MRTVEQIKAAIAARLGFIPPFFTPAEATPLVLENLWQQTCLAYLDNPLPDLFKEKLFAYLSRYCRVPYSLVSHSCALQALGMKPSKILALLETPTPTITDIDRYLQQLIAQPIDLNRWSEINAALEEALFFCAVFIFLQQETEDCYDRLSQCLGATHYQYLIILIAHIKACHLWTEAHPHISYQQNPHAQKQLEQMLEIEPGLAGFFCRYQEKVSCEQHNQATHLVSHAQNKSTEAALQESEERLRICVEAANIGIWDANLVTGEEIWSAQNEALYGLSPGTFGGTMQDLRSLVHPEDLAAFDIAHNQALKIGKFQLEYRTIRPDGKIRWIASQGRVFYDKSGSPLRSRGVDRDITDYKQAEAALRLSEARFRRLFDSNMIGLCFCDYTGSVSEANDAYLELVGYSRDDLEAGLVRWDEMTPEEYLWVNDRIDEELAQYKVSAMYETEYIRKDGMRVPILIGVAYLEDGQRDDLEVAFVIDISDRKQAENQLRSSLQEKEVLLKEIHHRVKNNLQIISSLLNLQARSIQDSTLLTPYRETQSRIQAMALIHENLYQSISLDRVNFGSYIRDLATSILQSYSAHSRNIHLTIDVDNVELNINTAIPCGLIINELVTNALKHAFPDNRSGEINIHFALNETGQHVLTIRDTGIGLPKELNIGEVKSLGMKLVDALTHQLQGTFESSSGNGSTFTVAFPELKT